MNTRSARAGSLRGYCVVMPQVSVGTATASLSVEIKSKLVQIIIDAVEVYLLLENVWVDGLETLFTLTGIQTTQMKVGGGWKLQQRT